MENHFYHIERPPLNVTTFITHMCNGSYANDYTLRSVCTITILVTALHLKTALHVTLRVDNLSNLEMLKRRSWQEGSSVVL